MATRWKQPIVSDSGPAYDWIRRFVRLLENLRQLARGPQQIEFSLLAREICIKEGEPFLIFVKLRHFQIANAGAALLKLRLQHLQILLCQFELQARYLATRIPFPGLAGLMTHIQRDLRSLALHLHSRSRQIGLRESHGCAGMRRKNGNLDIDSDDEVIALKFIEELIVVVEFRQEIILADQSECGPIASTLPFQA